jgi:putative methanogenesis marker protein 12
MVFVGISHGTTAIRIAVLEADRPNQAQTYELLKEGTTKGFMEFLGGIVDLRDIEMAAVAYSMGDAISSIMPMDKVKDRGVTSLEGVGPLTGIGTDMFDGIANSGVPVVILPGLHRQCNWLDPRFTILQSHVASPKKVAASFHCFEQMSIGRPIKDAIVANVSSNTVTVLIKDGKVVGGIDACLVAPGLRHGPLDVEAIRRVDAGHMTANEAFSAGGILQAPLNTPEKLFNAVRKGNTWAKLRIDALVLALLIEISGLRTAAGGVDTVAVTGALGEVREPVDIGAMISEGIGVHVHVFSKFSGAIGAAEMASMIKDGSKEILGIPVDL